MENQKVNTRGSMVRKIGNLVWNEGRERENPAQCSRYSTNILMVVYEECMGDDESYF